LSVSASANVSIAKGGVAIGAALADTSTHAGGRGQRHRSQLRQRRNQQRRQHRRQAGSSGQAVSVALTVEGTASGLAAARRSSMRASTPRPPPSAWTVGRATIA